LAWSFVLGCLVGGVFDFIDLGLGQVSYAFDESVPFAIEEVRDYVADMIDTHPGSGYVVQFLPERQYLALHFNGGARIQYQWNLILFNADRYIDDIERFKVILVHELLHAWGVDHSENPKSIMYPEYSPGQQLLFMDRFALWIAKQRTNQKNRD
jgi:hypothetical protein